ncbi:hypothetical protein EZI54_18590 [Marinobacter halodurans]|uniref:Tetratricopeptide repeat protein n=1 Tax=Marinobacter halodurans TaxID=2528979 RepID=A0ABY1ZIM0_9GAMM|nr:tetratricopeptide repeat protein [Marinobacter halodurans]TBW50158.1 hypothetical protein EZI54_18590 [Marinobacter halodurans]
MRAVLSLVFAATMLPTGPARADAVNRSDRIRDVARYELLVGHADRALHEIWNDTSPQSGMLRGEAYARMGIAAKARDALLAVRSDGQALSDPALLALARSQLQLGDNQAAYDALTVLVRRSRQAEGLEAAYLLAEAAIESEAYDRAGQILGKSPDGYWTAMGYLNLATAYARQDSDTARSLIALRVARAMLGDEAATDYPELLQRIQVTAGYLALRSDDPDKALSFLNKVTLNGYYTPQALYLHGLALARKDNYRSAMQSWHRARKFPLGFPGAADAWLGMGRGYDESGYLGQAGEAYLAAISAFEGELVTLRTLRGQVREQGGYEAMVRSAGRDDVEWFLVDSKTLTQPRLAYLIHFMEHPDAQQAVRDVAGLTRMERQLQRRLSDLDVFEGMLKGRLKQVSHQGNSARIARVGEGIERLSQRLQTLQARLDDAGEQGQVADLATGETADKLARIRRIRSQKNLTPEEQARLDRLEGVLTWKAQEGFDRARREHASHLASISGSLDAAKTAYKRFDSELNRTPERFRELLSRVKAARSQTQSLIMRVESMREQVGDQLDQRLMAFLDDQASQMNAHLDRSEQQLAHLYEHLALNNAASGRTGGDQ